MTEETKIIKLGVINVQAVVLQTPGVATLREDEQKKREDLQRESKRQNVLKKAGTL